MSVTAWARACGVRAPACRCHVRGGRRGGRRRYSGRRRGRLTQPAGSPRAQVVVRVAWCVCMGGGQFNNKLPRLRVATRRRGLRWRPVGQRCALTHCSDSGYTLRCRSHTGCGLSVHLDPGCPVSAHRTTCAVSQRRIAGAGAAGLRSLWHTLGAVARREGAAACVRACMHACMRASVVVPYRENSVRAHASPGVASRPGAGLLLPADRMGTRAAREAVSARTRAPRRAAAGLRRGAARRAPAHARTRMGEPHAYLFHGQMAQYLGFCAGALLGMP